jgi:2-oxoglutarate dehydrogenase E1 component
MMYQTIGKRPTIYHIFAEKIIKEGVISEEEVKTLWSTELSKISEAYAESLKSTFDIKAWRSPTYHRVVDFTNLGEIKKTGISSDLLREIGQKISNVP